MNVLSSLVQRVTRRTTSNRGDFPLPVDIPPDFSFYDLCQYVNALYNVAEEARQKFLETREDHYALLAIDSLITINQLEQMKKRLEVQIYHS